VIPPDLSKPLGFGHVMMALPVNGFIPMEVFTSRLNQYIDQLRQSPLAEGFDEIVVPNEKEFRTEMNRRKAGIPLSRTTVDELNRLAEKYQVPAPF
jgi:LDH2 family malate/lactate/ureidoglycolate dehydrogenase